MRPGELDDLLLEECRGLGVRLYERPSPLSKCEELGERLGVELFLKREDLLSDFDFGHKLRKLKYFVTRAQGRGAWKLLSAGSLPSGQNPAVAYVARRLGMQSHLIYTGDHQTCPGSPTGNYLTALLLGDEVTWYERSPWSEVGDRLSEVAALERARGSLPLVILPGISKWPGPLGSLEMGVEIAEQLRALRESGEARSSDIHLWMAAGSGVTLAGVEAASILLDARWKTHGVAIGSDVASAMETVHHVHQRVEDWLGAGAILRSTAKIHAGFAGDGYDSPTSAELQRIGDLASSFGLLLDPNYMVKTFIGLERSIQEGVVPQGATVVLIVSGGKLGLFGGNVLVSDWIRSRRAKVKLEVSPAHGEVR